MAAERWFSPVLTQRANEKNGVVAIDNDSRVRSVLKGDLAMKIQLRMLALIMAAATRVILAGFGGGS